MLIKRTGKEKRVIVDKQHVTHIVVRQYQASTLYSERETAVACHLSLASVRSLRVQGLIEGTTIDGEMRYSDDAIAQLRRIRRLRYDLGINLAGVEVILGLLRRVDGLRQELEQARTQGQEQEKKP
jgi:DNA-binding transcriptional MerR regulator